MNDTLAYFFLFLLLTGATSAVMANENTIKNSDSLEIEEPLYKPLIERYILDELKFLRQEQQAMKAELVEKVAHAKLEASDRAIRYTADTTNNIFYIITAAASILVFLGWKSITDIKDNLETVITKRVEKLTSEYEQRLNALEATITERSNQIVAAQKEISDSNLTHALWMRAGLEKNEHEKIHIFDQILDINPMDIEALCYKADTLLDMNEDNWALSLAEQAIEQDADYALAYWQRACAKAKLHLSFDAIEDIKKAIDLSSSWRDELANEVHFESIKNLPEFIALYSADPGA